MVQELAGANMLQITVDVSNPLGVDLGIADRIGQAVILVFLVEKHIPGFTSNAVCLHRLLVFFIHYGLPRAQVFCRLR
jgi:hypothetical protein